MCIRDGIVFRICTGHACGRRWRAIDARLREVIAERSLAGEVGVAHQPCFGRCALGPNVVVERYRGGLRNEKAMLAVAMGAKHPDMRFEHGVAPEDLDEMVRWHHAAWRRSLDDGGP